MTRKKNPAEMPPAEALALALRFAVEELEWVQKELACETLERFETANRLEVVQRVSSVALSYWESTK